MPEEMSKARNRMAAICAGLVSACAKCHPLAVSRVLSGLAVLHCRRRRLTVVIYLFSKRLQSPSARTVGLGDIRAVGFLALAVWLTLFQH